MGVIYGNNLRLQNLLQIAIPSSTEGRNERFAGVKDWRLYYAVA